MARERRTEWVKRVARWRDSGLTAREFAAETGINAHTLQHWAWRLRTDEQERGAPAPHVAPTSVPNVEFVEVRTADDAKAIAVLEIVLPRGATIRVPPQFDEAALRRVIAVLEASA